MSRRRRGFTLLEMVVALTVLAVLSVSVTALLYGALNTDRHVRQVGSAASEVDLAVRRITHNVRTASAMSSPAGTTAVSTLSTVTQPDASNGGATYTVTYALVNGDLVETDSRYGTNTLVRDVSAFTVALQGSGSPRVVVITLQAGEGTGVRRQFRVACRNL